MRLIATGIQKRFDLQRRRIGGVSLIEVLVSIVIASIALLALAGVNASSIRYTKMSQYRATAALLANDMGERMRANRGKPADAVAVPAIAATGFMAGAYDYAVIFANQATKASLPTELCNTAASKCTPAEIAALDLAQWRILVRDQLPGGSVFIALDTADIAADIWIAWSDPAVAAADEEPKSATKECPDAMSVDASSSVRCGFFRINL